MTRIAIQGEPGSFSHEAATRLAAELGEQPRIVPFSLSAEVFAALVRGDVDAAAIPIENSLAGSVTEHFDLMLQNDVTIERELLLRIRHNLIGLSGANLKEIDRVFSHPVALAQCRRFLAEHPHMESFAFYDTAGSVKQLVELRDRHAGAIASREAASYYGAQILAADIEDNPENYTRFFYLRRSADAIQSSYANKMSLAFKVENRVGTLVAALSELAKEGTNLTKIESRPVHGHPWEYVFYVDCQLHSPEDGARAVTALRSHCSMVKELGRYIEAAL
ncbi:prephenate dehydratase [Acidicapsa dinghuensis]|uniref:Prephenate dehydratase n=1 Tax=Acidicapsa dinghuensis TaxID=2218256 RepID=A0ABW1EII1_9BACT|nr:prephenate dehydratase [Acidicapsa dinghuensis]